jgi:hypothetical protein
MIRKEWTIIRTYAKQNQVCSEHHMCLQEKTVQPTVISWKIFSAAEDHLSWFYTVQILSWQYWTLSRLCMWKLAFAEKCLSSITDTCDLGRKLGPESNHGFLDPPDKEEEKPQEVLDDKGWPQGEARWCRRFGWSLYMLHASIKYIYPDRILDVIMFLMDACS